MHGKQNASEGARRSWLLTPAIDWSIALLWHAGWWFVRRAPHCWLMLLDGWTGLLSLVDFSVCFWITVWADHGRYPIQKKTKKLGRQKKWTNETIRKFPNYTNKFSRKLFVSLVFNPLFQHNSTPVGLRLASSDERKICTLREPKWITSIFTLITKHIIYNTNIAI